jgi:hypothetical protein
MKRISSVEVGFFPIEVLHYIFMFELKAWFKCS